MISGIQCGFVTDFAVVKIEFKVTENHAVVGTGEGFGEGRSLLFWRIDRTNRVKENLPLGFSGSGVAVPLSVFACEGETKGGFALDAEE